MKYTRIKYTRKHLCQSKLLGLYLHIHTYIHLDEYVHIWREREGIIKEIFYLNFINFKCLDAKKKNPEIKQQRQLYY